SAQQGRTDRAPPETGGGLAYYEAVSSPSALPGRSRVDILYRIDLSFFIAVRDESAPLSSDFVREGEIQIEMIDSTGKVASRKIDRFSKPGKSSQPPPSTHWYEGSVSFNLVPASYTISLTVEDLESTRTFTERHKVVHAADFLPNTAVAAAPFFLSGQGTQDEFRPQNVGGGIRFGDSATLMMVIGNNDSSSSGEVAIMVWEQIPGTNDTTMIISRTQVIPERRDSSELSVPKGDPPAYTLLPSAAGHSVLYFPFPSQVLRQGRYQLQVTVGSLPPGSVMFEVVWPDIPRSLRDIEYALEALRYITGKDELDSLRSGSDETLRSNLEGFWSERDGTPETAYNEVMTEYYRRVDHSAISFGTLREPDGTSTDQGRIYILYGKPTRTERKLDPSGYIEIWSYKEARKQFVFIDESRKGEYVLTSTRPL
ncbi:MAG: GWxTD domain-containing protein, partial [Ignavibacteria bacterium]|nr:GWxTD domain-containing protein [Ignavibacteria bacterium]